MRKFGPKDVKLLCRSLRILPLSRVRFCETTKCCVTPWNEGAVYTTLEDQKKEKDRDSTTNTASNNRLFCSILPTNWRVDLGEARCSWRVKRPRFLLKGRTGLTSWTPPSSHLFPSILAFFLLHLSRSLRLYITFSTCLSLYVFPPAGLSLLLSSFLLIMSSPLVEEATRIAREFDFSADQVRRGVAEYIQQANEGLTKENTTLSQIPTFVTAVPNGTEKVRTPVQPAYLPAADCL